MIHATQKALDKLEPLLTKIREFSTLKEKKRGCFYLKSNAFLHFHEDLSGLYADMMIDGQWQRFCVSSEPEYHAFIDVVSQVLDR